MIADRRRYAAAVAGMAVALISSAPPLPAQRDPRAETDAFVARQLELREIPAASVAVIRDGEVVMAKGYGTSDLQAGTAATERTVYPLASVTKQFTSTAIMMLVEEGRLELDTPVTEILPALPDGWSGVTIHHLLNHTSGIPSYTGIASFHEEPERRFEHDEVIALVRDMPLEFEPGSGWSYNNTGYYLLGMIIEKVTGADYGAFIQERIFTPLAMSTAGMNDPAARAPERARGYVLVEGQPRLSPSVDPSQPFAAGALAASVLDLARWEAALAGETLLEREVLDLMWSPTALPDGSIRPYGYGWELSEYRGRRRIAHGGGIRGFSTQVTRFPDDGLAVIVLTNQQGGAAELLANGVASIFIPELRAAAPQPIADGDTATTNRLRAVTMRLAAGEGNPDEFTTQARAFFFPERIRQGSQLGSYGALGDFELMEERTEGEVTHRGYRAVFGGIPMRITYTLEASGEIAGIGIRPNDPV